MLLINGSTGSRPRLQSLEEVVPLVIHKNKGGEIFHLNLPDGLHAELRILYTLDALDAAL
jgi:hypothetical protein